VAQDNDVSVREGYADKNKLDGCIVWNAHNTVRDSKRLALCACVTV